MASSVGYALPGLGDGLSSGAELLPQPRWADVVSAADVRNRTFTTFISGLDFRAFFRAELFGPAPFWRTVNDRLATWCGLRIGAAISDIAKRLSAAYIKLFHLRQVEQDRALGCEAGQHIIAEFPKHADERNHQGVTLAHVADNVGNRTIIKLPDVVFIHAEFYQRGGLVLQFHHATDGANDARFVAISQLIHLSPTYIGFRIKDGFFNASERCAQ